MRKNQPMFHRSSRLVALLLVALAPLAVAGCFDFGTNNDVIDAQEQSRLHRGIPGPTELPPGLGDDLPAATTKPAP